MRRCNSVSTSLRVPTVCKDLLQIAYVPLEASVVGIKKVRGYISIHVRLLTTRYRIEYYLSDSEK